MVTTAFLAVFLLLLSALFAVAVVTLAQRLMSLEFRQSHNAAIGIIYGTLHVTFGVIVGFSAFLVLSKYAASRDMAAIEAGDVVQIHRLAEGFPEPQRDRIQELTASYAQVVVDEEWPLMREGRTSSRAGALVAELQRNIQVFEPGTETEKALYGQGLQRVLDLEEKREIRLLHVREGLPPILWIVLGILAIIIMLFASFLGMESAWLHRAAVAALAAGITLIMFTIVALDHPFGGYFRVGPDAFQLALNTIEENSGIAPVGRTTEDEERRSSGRGFGCQVQHRTIGPGGEKPVAGDGAGVHQTRPSILSKCSSSDTSSTRSKLESTISRLCPTRSWKIGPYWRASFINAEWASPPP
jgi:hypothetical protein